jgi:hypothetical protein
MIRTLNKLEIEQIFFNTIKAIYDKHTASITLKYEKLKNFPINSVLSMSVPERSLHESLVSRVVVLGGAVNL